MIRRLSCILVMGIVAVVLNPGAWCRPLTADEPVAELNVKAMRYRYEPAHLKVCSGAKVSLTVTSRDVDHGFKLDTIDVEVAVKAKTSETITFTASEPGTYPFKCSVYCGRGHKRMRGILEVVSCPPGQAIPLEKDRSPTNEGESHKAEG